VHKCDIEAITCQRQLIDAGADSMHEPLRRRAFWTKGRKVVGPLDVGFLRRGYKRDAKDLFEAAVWRYVLLSITRLMRIPQSLYELPHVFQPTDRTKGRKPKLRGVKWERCTAVRAMFVEPAKGAHIKLPIVGLEGQLGLIKQRKWRQLGSVVIDVHES